MSKQVKIAGEVIKPDTQVTLNLPIPQLYTHTPMEMPVHIVRGKHDGPRLFVCAAIHGDELNGVEIIRRLMGQSNLRRIRGTLIAIPIVNVYGVIHHSRYLPDRRDLNRSFPGSDKGSLASRLAHLLMTEVVANATHAIDLHTGAVHRSNVPQIRADLDGKDTKQLAKAFGVPVIINSKLRDGSLRAAACDLGIPIMIYEAGEALRFDEVSIRAGLRGINNVIYALGMLPVKRNRKTSKQPFIAESSAWVRAPMSGVLLNNTKLGTTVTEGDILAAVADPFGQTQTEIKAITSGVVIGRTHLPLVNEGDAIIHIARFDDVSAVANQVSAFHNHEQQAIDSDDAPPIV
ncbi:MAG: succinylglutamate desuccinylase/aspartoacylase family protein [Gammaproteobacteria bacterium]|nr:succinylglutamate desuccinylase/aspartoacylase family protein [Gammaproteobacteria bacterium]